MKDLLNDVFGGLKTKYPDFKILGREAVMSLNQNKYAKVYFTIYAGSGTPISEHYNGIKIDIYDRNTGKLDGLTVGFHDVFDSIIDLSHPNRIGKHIWREKGKYSWYGKPTQKDLKDLFNEVDTYLDMMHVREAPDLAPLRDVVVLVCTHDSRFGAVSYVSFHATEEAALKHSEFVADECEYDQERLEERFHVDIKHFDFSKFPIVSELLNNSRRPAIDEQIHSANSQKRDSVDKNQNRDLAQEV